MVAARRGRKMKMKRMTKRRRTPEMSSRQVELRRDCPYFDTVNRQVYILLAF